MLNVSFNMTLRAAQEGFFDRDRVTNALDKATAGVLSKFGSFVMTKARQSIKSAPKTTRSAKYTYNIYSRQATSLPGNPPLSHTGKLKENIFFDYDKARKSVVIGPIRLNQVTHRGPSFASRQHGLAAETLEYGGIISIFEVRWPGGQWRRADLRSRRRIAQMQQRWRTIRIAPRPYMQPAFEKELRNPKLTGLWQNSVKKAA